MKTVLSVVMLSVVAIAAAAQQHPKSAPDPQRQQALGFEQQGDIAQAEAAWTALSKANPRNPEPYARLALLKARRQDYKGAIPLYRKALALDPNKPAVRLNLGLALFKAEELKDALLEFKTLRKQAKTDSPEAQRLDVLIGMCYYGLAQYGSAVPYLKAAAQRDQQNSPLLLSLAHSCLWSKQLQCVMDTYHQILSINAESAEADMLAGEALDEMKDNEGSTKMFRAAVAANPKEPNAHFGLGYLLWTQKQYPEALQQFQAELENDPNHAQSLVYLGDCYLQLNNPTEARPRLQKGLALDPNQWLASLDLGIIDSDAGRNEEALRELNLAAKLKPDDVNVHWRLGRLLRTMGKMQEAQLELEKARTLNKAADEDLYKKIANGAKRGNPPSVQEPPPAQ
ncbi:tetratricopeptide repeat protein [Occallatibacter savannae]|uniref:tetratricopeptide repeat protein n=1 Tax=Occallatibacter savannae TaxID=1002691 RepID=UPI000D69601B|nr:tetratricopeptide repeat protein [Occallatibacter savannae]